MPAKQQVQGTVKAAPRMNVEPKVGLPARDAGVGPTERATEKPRPRYWLKAAAQSCVKMAGEGPHTGCPSHTSMSA
jgi:hypothetical protein